MGPSKSLAFVALLLSLLVGGHAGPVRPSKVTRAGPWAPSSSSSRAEPPAASPDAWDGKWDTGVFIRAMVETQRDQIRSEIDRVRSLIPIGTIINTNRSPYEVGRAAGTLIMGTANSYVSSFMMGYGLGSITYLSLDASKKAALKRFFPKYPGFHLKGMKQGKQFGGFCALFTLFEGGLSLMRGVEDKWNPIVGAAAVGVYTSRHKSIQEMVMSGAMFGGFNYFFSAMGDKQKAEEEEEEKKKPQPKQKREVAGRHAVDRLKL